MPDKDVSVHPSSFVHKNAHLEPGVSVGSYSHIGEGVVILGGTKIDAHVHIEGPTEIGPDNRFYPFSSIGSDPQDVGYKEEDTKLVIGRGNIFREFMTVNRGTIKGGGVTTVGDDNYFMAYSHIGHDSSVGNEVVFMNACTLGGHVSIHDFVTISAHTGVHQFCRVGKHAYVGGYSVITQDVLPFCRVAGGRPPLLYGVNALGLRRRGFSRQRISNIKDMIKLLLYSDLNTAQAVERIKSGCVPGEDREEVMSFVETSSRGIIKKTAGKWDKPMD